MEFKGTKGKWYTSHRKKTNGMYSTEVYCDKGDTIATISWYKADAINVVFRGKKSIKIGTYRDENAQLIAHAPELLEMVKKLMDYMPKRSDKDADVYREALELVKSATTI